MAIILPKSINLLEPVLEPEDIWTKIYNWIIGYGKFIFLLVSIIVLGVFFSRFYFDRINNDLTENVNHKIDDILGDPNLRKEEQSYRNYQYLLTDLRYLDENQTKQSKKIAKIIDNIPNNFEMLSFSYSQAKVDMSFTTDSFDNISKYTSRLDSDQAYEEVTSNVSKDESSEGKISFSVSFKIVE